jgi:hypothetical protein
MKKAPLAVAALLLGAACAPRMQPIRPIVENGGTIPATAGEAVARAGADGRAERERLADERDATAAEALASCRGATCDALARGEIAVGMTEAQVMAATGTTVEAWERRGGDGMAILAARWQDQPVSDAVAEVAMVTMQGGRVRSYTYREPQGLRLVASAEDATPAARARSRAAVLLREGDDLAARGDFVGALDRYDRADVVSPNDPETTLRIARALDKQLRPLEARMRYQLFLHQMELETIRAHGEAYAHLYAAVAEARDRILVLDRRGR